MNLNLTAEQEMLKKSYRDFLAKECEKSLVREMYEEERGYSVALWDKMAGLGWMGLPFPEKYGGQDGSFLDLAVLLEEMGRACLPSPFFSTVVEGGLTCLESGSEFQKQELLPKISQGKLVVTMALTEQNVGYSPASITMRALQKGNEFVINGTKLFVRNAHVADYLICVARTEDSSRNDKEGITLFWLDTKSSGIRLTLLDTFVGDKQFEVEFDRVRVTQENVLGELGRGWKYLTKILQKAAIAKCAEILGALQQILEMTVNYAKQRIQFNQPIGSFQAIQHHCANMMVYVDSSKLITYQAAWLLSEGIPSTKEVAMAKTWVGDTCELVINLAHQVIGGISIIDDHDLPLYTRQILEWSEIFGNSDFHREIIANELGL